MSPPARDRIHRQPHIYKGKSKVRLYCQQPHRTAPKVWFVQRRPYCVRDSSDRPAIASTGYGPRLHHIWVWAKSLTDVSLACDLLSTYWMAGEHGAPTGPASLSGRPPYIVCARSCGHRVELFTCDYATISPSIRTSSLSARSPRSAASNALGAEPIRRTLAPEERTAASRISQHATFSPSQPAILRAERSAGPGARLPP